MEREFLEGGRGDGILSLQKANMAAATLDLLERRQKFKLISGYYLL